jgi:2-polyprenyl-3-methyl-5-hydroxy-6-metoxy-1,4-benzoquinol methylase
MGRDFVSEPLATILLIVLRFSVLKALIKPTVTFFKYIRRKELSRASKSVLRNPSKFEKETNKSTKGFTATPPDTLRYMIHFIPRSDC